MSSIDGLRCGQSGEIVRVAGTDPIACRLREMGFIPGEQVRLVAIAPLGDPLACEIQGGRVALRRSEAERVTVTLCQPPTSPASDSTPS